MTTGIENQNTKQCGEYLVASLLFRKGYVNTTFTGNMPHYDIIAVNKKGKLKRIQVKTTTRYTFRLNLKNYAKVKQRGNKQSLEGKTKLKNPDIVNIFVKLADTNPKSKWKQDEFYILTDHETQKVNYKRYKSFLKKHNGRRPKNPKSLYDTVSTDDLAAYQDTPSRNRWSILED